jgi:hypothetical protein
MTYPNRFTHPQLPLQHSNLPTQGPPPTKDPEPQSQHDTPPPGAKVVCVYQDPNKPDHALTEHLLVAAAEAKRTPQNPNPRPLSPNTFQQNLIAPTNTNATPVNARSASTPTVKPSKKPTSTGPLQTPSERNSTYPRASPSTATH